MKWRVISYWKNILALRECWGSGFFRGGHLNWFLHSQPGAALSAREMGAALRGQWQVVYPEELSLASSGNPAAQGPQVGRLPCPRLASLPPHSMFPEFLPGQWVGPPKTWGCSDGHLIRECVWGKESHWGAKSFHRFLPVTSAAPQDPGVM